MNPTLSRRYHRRSAPSRSEGAFFKKESQHEQSFFGEASHDVFFQPAVASTQSIQRKCEECEKEDKVHRMEDKKEEEKTVMRAEDKKEEEKVQREPEKKEEEKIHRLEDKKEDEKVQREPEKKEEEKIQKKETGATTAAGAPISNYVGSLNGKGHSLPAASNHFFSSRMGYDFSNVKIHKDKQAAESAKDINAKAYTIGNNIVFNEGQYDLESGEGKKLMAHELAHVVQQDSDTINRFLPFDIYESDWINNLRKDPAFNLIMNYSSRTGLDEDGLGEKLFWLTWQSEQHYAFVLEVFKKLDSDDEDEVAEKFLELANTIKDAETEETVINRLASTPEGSSLLQHIYYAIGSGHISDEEEVMGKTALIAFIKQMPLEDYAAGIEKAPILPFRPPGPFTYDDSPIMAERLSDGNIKVHIPQRVQGTSMFENEVKTLDERIFLKSGLIFNPQEIVGIKDYSTDESISYMPAMSLILYSAKGDTMVINKIVDVATLIIGGGVGKATTWVGKSLIFLDRVAVAVGAVSLIVNDHRNWILKHFPNAGKKILKTIDTINHIAGIYGISRLVTGVGYELIKALRNKKLLLNEEAAIVGLSNDPKVTQLEKSMDEISSNMEQARKKMAEESGSGKYQNETYPEIERLTKQNDQEAAAELVKREDKFFEWEKNLNKETQEFLDSNQSLRRTYQEMPDEIRNLFTHCASVCVTNAVTREGVARVKEMIDRMGGVTKADAERLKILFHLPRDVNDLDLFIRFLSDVKTSDDLRRKLIQGFRTRAMMPVGFGQPLNPKQLRQTPGIAEGGENLAHISTADDWLKSTGGDVAFIPGQIADKLRGKVFPNIKEFTKAFWKTVGNDPVLSQAFSKSDIYRMTVLELAPRVGKLQRQGKEVVYILHHMQPVEYGGAVYGLDNIAIVTPEFHHLIHD